LTFDISIDKFTDDIQFIKLNRIEDFLNSEAGGNGTALMLEDLYNLLFDEYKRLDAEFLQKIVDLYANSDGQEELETEVKNYLESPSTESVNKIYDKIKYYTVDDSVLEKLMGLLGVTIENAESLSTDARNEESFKAVEAGLLDKLKLYKFVEQYSNRNDRVTNNFIDAINKISISIGGNVDQTQKITGIIRKWADAIRNGDGYSLDGSIDKEDLEHMSHVLNVFQVVAKTMAPVIDKTEGT